MDILLNIGSIVVILAIFGILAAVVGEDTRDGFHDDPRLSPRFR